MKYSLLYRGTKSCKLLKSVHNPDLLENMDFLIFRYYVHLNIFNIFLRTLICILWLFPLCNWFLLNGVEINKEK